VGWEPCRCSPPRAGHRTYWCQVCGAVAWVSPCLRSEVGTAERMQARASGKVYRDERIPGRRPSPPTSRRRAQERAATGCARRAGGAAVTRAPSPEPPPTNQPTGAGGALLVGPAAFRYACRGNVTYGVRMAVSRSDGAREWTTVLSELAGVPVTVEWDRPAWRVRWVDGPTRAALMDRAIALDRYRVGAPLPARDLRFVRSSSAVAIALAWLALADEPVLAGAVGRIEQIAEDTGYPQQRVDAASVAAATLLSRLAGGQSATMGRLLTAADPPVPAPTPARPMPAIAGRVCSIRWPAGGPPGSLLGPGESSSACIDRARTCAHCGTVLPANRGSAGRPRRYCSGACRVAAHRAAHRDR
jgi:hypothetical protein